MVTTKVNLIKWQYVLVSDKKLPILLQSLGDEVRIAFSELQPAKSNSVFHMVQSRSFLEFEYNDTNLWAMSLTDNSSIIVTEGAPLGYN